jgi:hypothetical protein
MRRAIGSASAADHHQAGLVSARNRFFQRTHGNLPGKRRLVAARKHHVDAIRQRPADGYGGVVTHQHVLAGGQLLEPAQVVGQMPGQLPFQTDGEVLVEGGNQRNSHDIPWAA